MYPTLRPGERVLFDRLAYRTEAPQVGDVVLARHSERPGVRLLKRVALPPKESALGEGEVWLLGDNADQSTDSRQLGPFRREDVLARGWLVYWPPERFRLVQRE
jgi:nickel-type superoxide dismutase maturation protease